VSKHAAPPSIARRAEVALAFGLGLASCDAAAERGLSTVAQRAAEAPVLDGVLDEAAWAAAEPITDFVQIDPVLGAAPSEPTEVRILYDADYLYIGARLHDRDPAHIVRNVMVRQPRLFGEDRLHVILDTFHDRRNGYYFEVNPNGLRADALIENNTTLIESWDGIWDAASSVDDGGWSTELRIPMKSLSFDANADAWGLNLYRSISARGEFLSWNTDIIADQPYAPALAGRLTGLEGLRQGVGLDVTPSLTVHQHDGRATHTESTEWEPSLDLLYKLTNATTAALTLNTDFSATEVDDRQVNLTRFSLFFPEKRTFFLQDAGIFEFGGLAENGRPFFSRTIGLGANGEPLDLEGGLKVTGREGRASFGALAVRQSAGTATPAQNLFVGRGVVNVLEQSSAGVIATMGDPEGGDNSVVGGDFRYRNAHLPGNQVLEATAWAQRSHTPGTAGGDAAYGGSFRLPNDRWYVENFATWIEPSFDPAMGFVNRPGIRNLNGFFRFRTRPEDSDWLIANNYWLFLEQVDDLAGNVQSGVVEVMPWGPYSKGNDFYRPMWQRFREVPTEAFLLFDRLPVAAGDYSFDHWSFRVETSEARALRVYATVGAGDFYDGERRSFELDSTWRVSRHLSLDVDWQWDDVRLSSGSFISRLYRSRLAWALNARTAWILLAQYDNVSRALGLDLRLQWLPRAGQEVYFIVQEGAFRDPDDRFVTQTADATFKALYTWRW